MKKITSTTLKIAIPLLISAVVLYFTYRDYDFSQFWTDMGSIKWGWLIGALSFSALGPLFRGLRWNLLLEPIGYDVPKKDTVLTVFTGYAANIIIPQQRSGNAGCRTCGRCGPAGTHCSGRHPGFVG